MWIVTLGEAWPAVCVGKLTSSALSTALLELSMWWVHFGALQVSSNGYPASQDLCILCVCVCVCGCFLFFSLRTTKHVLFWLGSPQSPQFRICIQTFTSKQDCFQGCPFGKSYFGDMWLSRAPQRRRLTGNEDPELNLCVENGGGSKDFPGWQDWSQLLQHSLVPSIWGWSAPP